MPPRKRRQSAQGEEIPKENGERVVSETAAGNDGGKQQKNNLKPTESSCGEPERRLTARQQSKQDAQQVQEMAGKTKDSAIPGTSTTESTPKQPTRFSTRIVKRPRRDISPPESPVKKGKKAAVTPPITTPETKGKRQWELWSVEDKDSFFEGLCEFGKDFESIHNLIVNKCKKKGGVLPITVKNKEQVRHFYYRTWHKITKLIQPVEDLKKDIQELYGLISYSVLRKKLRGGVNPNDKNWQKLNDLVHQGVATIKVKGKRIRVKTPICNALKRLNSYEEPKREPGPKVPEKIRVEFRPKTNIAWQHVQDLSHNPRVRVTVQSDRHLQSLVKYLEQKWKPPRLKLRESLNDIERVREEFHVYPHQDSTLRNICMEAVDEPVLQFCLNRHCKDNMCSPSTSKKKKEKDMSVSTKTCTSVSVGAGSTTDQSKSVICEPSCVCKDSCNALRQSKCCGPANDLMKSCASKDSLKLCSCMCNNDKTAAHCVDNDAASTECDAADGHIGSMAARSLFSAVTEPSKDVTIPSDSGNMKCVLAQNESPKYRSDEVMSSLSSSKSFSAPEISALVDGENAMFPDCIAGSCHESSDELAITETDSSVKVELDSSSGGTLEEFQIAIVSDEVDKTGEHNMQHAKSSQTEFKKLFENMLQNGWGVKEADNLTLAELYLMFGREGELRLEYEWISLRREAELLQEKLLNNLNNMLRRLSHLAMIEFTDFSKTLGSNSTCQLCGQNPNSKKTQGRGKDKNPTGPVKVGTSGKDAATQTHGFMVNPVPIDQRVSTSGQGGVFRYPVLPAPLASQPKATTTVIRPSKEQLAKYSQAYTSNTTQKQLMRPRKLKPVSRIRPGASGSLIQRTILPKNSEYITIIPMAPGTQIPNHPSDKSEATETIVGHPINGIQKHPISVLPSSPNDSSLRNPIILGSPSVTSSDTSGLMEISLSPEGDQTLLRIPASHLGTMSQEALNAAGLSTMPSPHVGLSTQPGSPISMATTSVSTQLSTYNSNSTLTTSAKSSLSPPNLSVLLDISLPAADLETNTSFTGFLEGNKTLMLEPILTTPPICAISEHQLQRTIGLHSPPVRSLFQTSPTPEHQWLNADVNDLSLSSFLDTPSRPTAPSSTCIFNPNMPLSLFNENSRDFQSHRIDVDSTLQSLMNESSIDYAKKFADLAEQINEDAMYHTKKPE